VFRDVQLATFLEIHFSTVSGSRVPLTSDGVTEVTPSLAGRVLPAEIEQRPADREDLLALDPVDDARR